MTSIAGYGLRTGVATLLGGLALLLGFIFVAFAGPAPVGSQGIAVFSETRRFSGHQDGVWCVVFSPDGRQALSSSYDHTVRLWDIASGKETLKLDGFPAAVVSVAFLPDAASCVCSCTDGSVHFRSLKTGKEISRLLAHHGSVNSLCLSSDGKTLVTGGADGLVKVWDCATAKEKRTLSGSGDWIWSVALSPDGKQVLAGGADKSARLWALDTGKEISQLSGHQDAVTCVAFSPDGKQVLTGSNDGELRQWSLENGQMLRRMMGPKSPIYSVAFSREGKHGFSAGADGVVRLWELAVQDRQNGMAISGRGRRPVVLDAYGNPMNVDVGKEMRRYEGHDGAVYHIGLSRDGRALLSGGRDGTVRLWETRGIDSEVRDFSSHSGPVFMAAFSGDSSKVFTVSTGGFRSWDIGGAVNRSAPTSGQGLRGQKGRGFGGGQSGADLNVIHYGAVFPPGNRLGVVSPAGSVTIWDSETTSVSGTVTEGAGQLVTANTATPPRTVELGKIAGQYLAAVFTRDGKQVITGDSEGKLTAWDVQSGKELRSTQMQGKAIGVLALAPNGTDLLVASWRSNPQGKASDVLIKHLNRITLKDLRVFDGHKDLITGLVFSPSGQSFVSTSRDGTLLWWGLETKGKVQALVVPGAPVTAVAYVDNEHIVTAGSDNAIRLWQLLGAKELQRFDGHQSAINSLAVSPARHLLLSASNDRSARLWKLPGETASSQPQTKIGGMGKMMIK